MQSILNITLSDGGPDRESTEVVHITMNHRSTTRIVYAIVDGETVGRTQAVHLAIFQAHQDEGILALRKSSSEWRPPRTF